MADTITRVQSYSVEVADAAGAGADVLGKLAAAGVNLTAFWGYPIHRGESARLDMVAADEKALKAAARKAKIALVKSRPAFLIQGKDRIGAVGQALGKLAAAGINAYAAQAACAGGKFGCLISVDAADARKAAAALGAA